MKRKTLTIASLASATMLVGALAGCAEPAASNELGLASDGQLQVCTYPEYAPMEYFKNGTGGEISGFDVDLARAFGDHLEVKTSVSDTAFDSLIPGLATQRCDMVISGLYLSDEREKVATAVPYFLTGSALAAPPEIAAQLKQPKDLSGKKVAVQSGSSFIDLLKKVNEELASSGHAPVQVAEYPKTPLALGAVLAGKADAVLETDVAIADMVSKNDGAIVALDSIFPPDQVFGAYFRKESPLAKEFTAYLEQAVSAGDLEKLAEEYGLNSSRIVPGTTD